MMTAFRNCRKLSSFYDNFLLNCFRFILMHTVYSSGLAVLSSFSLVLQHCCYAVVSLFVRSLMVFVCQEIEDYLLTYLNWIDKTQLYNIRYL